MPETRLSSLEIRNAFRQPLPPIPVTRGYALRLVAVLGGLVLLQFLYLLLVGAVMAVTTLYTLALFGTGLSVNLFTILPPAAGVIVTLFLLKPLVIRPPRPLQPLQLRREREPVLFEFVDHLCRKLGAPRPSRIFVDLRTNASASIRGWRGFFFGHLDLIIGLPFAAGMSLPQFAGVLAHEFGHFSQHAGLRSHFLIQTIQGWFSRVVNQRDKMDAWLDRMLSRRDVRIKGVAFLAHVAVTGSRKYLALLMKAGAWLSASFSRQMEFDADRWETAMVGVEVFEETCRRAALLGVGLQLAWQDADRDWSVGRLPEDVAHLALTRNDFLPPEVAEQIMDGEMGQTTGRLDTHPCLSERLASARLSGFGRALDLDGSTERLFSDLRALCREATLYHYRTVLGIKENSLHLIPVAQAINNAQAEREYGAAVRALFGTTPRFCARWFRLPDAEPRILEQPSDEPAPAFDASAYDAALKINLDHFAALIVRRSGVAVEPAAFHLPAADYETIRREEEASTRNMTLAMEWNRQAAVGIAARIEGTIARILNQQLVIAISVDRTVGAPDVRDAWRCYGALSRYQDAILEIRRLYHALQIVRGNSRLFPAAMCANVLEDLAQRAVAEMEKIVSGCAEAPASIQLDPRCPATLGAQLDLPDSVGEQFIGEFLNRTDALLASAIGQLAWLTLAACPMPKSDSQAEAAS